MGKAVSITFTLRTCEQPQDAPSLLESDYRDAERGQVSESRRDQKFGEHIVLQSFSRTLSIGFEFQVYFVKFYLTDCPKSAYIISLISTNPYSPDQVLNDLSDIHPRISQAIEGAIAQARAFFEEKSRQFDVWLFSHMVRNETKEALQRMGQTLIQGGFEQKEMALSGLEFTFGVYCIKILKGKDGMLPAVGRSRAKREFFYQPSLLEQIGDYIRPLNLVIIWNIDTNYNLVELRLACPRSAKSYPDNSSEHWSISIPPASATIIVKRPFDDPVEDLPYERKLLQLTGTDPDETNDNDENN
jgi:hypothetical protein